MIIRSASKALPFILVITLMFTYGERAITKAVAAQIPSKPIISEKLKAVKAFIVGYERYAKKLSDRKLESILQLPDSYGMEAKISFKQSSTSNLGCDPNHRIDFPRSTRQNATGLFNKFAIQNALVSCNKIYK